MADETSTTKKEPSIQINPKLILSYVIDLRRCAQYYFETFNPTYARRLSSETQKQITRLDRLLFTGRRDTHPIASTILAVISVSSRSEANKSVEKILANIERIGFLILLVRYRSSHFQEIEPPLRVFRRCAKLLWHNEQSIEEVLTIFENYNSALTNVINIPDAIKTWGDKAYYGWESLAYFLFEYEVSLMEQSKTARHKLSWADFANEHYLADYSTIEHIYPQNPRSPAWHTLYSHFSKEERRALRNSLGNLLALSKPKNSTLSNRPFIEKCAGSTKMNGYRTGSYSEIEISTLSQWGAKEIVERGVRLLSFLEKRWDIPLGDDAKKIELLGLSSVLSKI
jgi:hypothetical protein